MKIVVHKYGGSSVATPARMQQVARRVVAAKGAGYALVVVTSARGDRTDRLIELARQVIPQPRRTEAKGEYDALLATGEKEAVALLALAIIARGQSAVSFTGAQAGIRTDEVHTKARIIRIKAEPIRAALQAGQIVVVAGFQGTDGGGRTTTLGRGGSDITAVALAAALGAERCEICKDVEGFYTANPKLVPQARKLPRLSYDEAMELASLGAEVTHPRAVEIARRHRLPILLRSSFNEHEGTWIKEETAMENGQDIRGVVCDKGEVKIAILEVPDRPGVAAEIFSALGEARIRADMIIQNLSRRGINDISFTIAQDDLPEALSVLEPIARRLDSQGISYDEATAKVSIVGGGIASSPEIAGQMFTALAEAGINIASISTSEIRISCLIAQAEADRAVDALHSCFGLGQSKGGG